MFGVGAREGEVRPLVRRGRGRIATTRAARRRGATKGRGVRRRRIDHGAVQRDRVRTDHVDGARAAAGVGRAGAEEEEARSGAALLRGGPLAGAERDPSGGVGAGEAAPRRSNRLGLEEEGDRGVAAAGVAVRAGGAEGGAGGGAAELLPRNLAIAEDGRWGGGGGDDEEEGVEVEGGPHSVMCCRVMCVGGR